MRNTRQRSESHRWRRLLVAIASSMFVCGSRSPLVADALGSTSTPPSDPPSTGTSPPSQPSDSTVPGTEPGSGSAPSQANTSVAASDPAAEHPPSSPPSSLDDLVDACPTPTYTPNGSRPSAWRGGGVVASAPGRVPPSPALDATAVLLSALRSVQSGPDYTTSLPGRSGAYLLADADWAGHGGVEHAADAPPDVQDERARQIAEQLLATGSTTDDVLALWFHSSVVNVGADGDVNGFVESVSARQLEVTRAFADARTATRPSAGGVVFPVAGPVTFNDTFGEPRAQGARCHEGTDIFGVAMQPILAPVTGTVGFVTDGEVPGVGLSISAGGVRYNLFHLARRAPGVATGSRVEAGQIVGYMGDTGNAQGGPVHLHVEIRDDAGTPLPSFAILEAASRAGTCAVVIGPDSAVVDDASHSDTSQVTVTSASGGGRWVIDTAGRVTASGDAALITPTAECELSDVVYGTDAAG